MRIRVISGLIAFLFISTTSASALTVLNFEGLPTDNYFRFGNQNIGTYYPGVNFGPDATILDSVLGTYNNGDFPAHSETAVFFSDTNPAVDITFDNPTSYVEGWFTFINGSGYLEAYDAANNLIDSDTMPSNSGSNAKMSVSASSIKWVRVHNTGDFWTGDDIAYESSTQAVPEPATLSLLGLGLLGLAKFGKRRK